MLVRAQLLREPQRDQIVEAIGKAGLDRGAFDLADDGVEFRIEHCAVRVLLHHLS